MNRLSRLCIATSLLLLASLFVSCGPSDANNGDTVDITFYTDSVGKQLEITKALAAEFEAKTGIHVEFLIGPNSATERLAEYQKALGARSSHADVYQIDVIWPGLLANHFIVLSDSIDPSEHFPAMIENNTVDGRLVAVPFFADAGLLYYRTDLLEKYGYDDPPANLDQLEEMARTIMQGERGEGDDQFVGYTFQGASYEGLTCNALEWQYGAGGGNFLTAEGEPNLSHPETSEVFARIRTWIDDIAPRGALTWTEEESRRPFQSGRAAFMRNWPYAYTLGQEEGSPIAGKFDICPMPGVEQPAATLGGWSLAVSRYSKHPDAAKQFVAYISTRSAQRRRALEGGYFATRPDVYGDEELSAKMPYYDRMKDVFLSAVARPSVPAGRHYNEISAEYYKAVHAILSGEVDAGPALAEAEDRIQRIQNR